MVAASLCRYTGLVGAVEDMAVRQAAFLMSEVMLAARRPAATHDTSLVRRALELLSASGVVVTALQGELAPDVGAGVVAGPGPGTGTAAFHRGPAASSLIILSRPLQAVARQHDGRRRIRPSS